MKKISSLVLSSLLVVGACKDFSSGPQASASLAAPTAASNAASFQPPPPLNGSMDGSVDGTAIAVGVTYFMNGPENNGWISFAANQPAGVSLSSPSARITIRNGVASGKGTLSITGVTQTYVVDLANASISGKFNGSCSASEGFIGGGDVVGGGRSGTCGSFSFKTTTGKTGFVTIRAGAAPVGVVGR